MGVACPDTLLHPPVVSYTAVSPLLCLAEERFAFCGPVPNVYTLPGVTRHAALWCADFPRTQSARVHPADLVLFWIYIIRLICWNCGLRQGRGIASITGVERQPVYDRALGRFSCHQTPFMPGNLRFGLVFYIG